MKVLVASENSLGKEYENSNRSVLRA